MNRDGKIGGKELKIEELLGNFLRLGVTHKNQLAEAAHLDDDSISAFVEGNLAAREAVPIVAHLVNCAFCRHVTAELIRLDLAFANEGPLEITEIREPTKLSDVLGGILGRIFGTGEEAVFAHQEPEDTEEVSDEENDSGTIGPG